MVKKTESSCSKKKVNRGAWTAEEDKKLAEYVKIHGDKKWRSLPANAGLNRCGKSCRLRWMNYLRPGIKRGNISEDEEDLIIRLHNLIGNRWSLIAGRLPGRTDNEIKNHWNTHLSKKSLTINQLNLKLNGKLEINVNRSSSGQGSIFPMPTLNPSFKYEDLHDDKMLHRLPENDFEMDIERFLELSWVSSLQGSNSVVPHESHEFEFGVRDSNPQGRGGGGLYNSFNQDLLHESNGQCFAQHVTYGLPDFDTLERLLEYEDDAFFSFSHG